MQELEREELARKGRKIWLTFVKEYNISNAVYVVIMPTDNREYNEAALLYLKRFLDKRGVKNAWILTYDPWVMEQQDVYCDYAQFVQWDKKDIEAVVQLYCLYEFSQNIIIASLEQPSGRMGKGIVGKKSLSLQEVFAGVVYSLVD